MADYNLKYEAVDHPLLWSVRKFQDDHIAIPDAQKLRLNAKNFTSQTQVFMKKNSHSKI